MSLKMENNSPEYGLNQTTKCTKVLQHFRKFCETTSLRGVPKIVLSRRKKLKLLWTTFVFAFFLACITSVALLISQYYAYDVIHQPKTSYNDPRDFPSATFCNLRPFSKNTIDLLKQKNIRGLNEFISDFEKALADMIRNQKVVAPKERGKFIKLLSSLFSMNHYLINLPSTINIDSFGHSRNSMVISCFVVYQNGSSSSAAKCDAAGKWILTKNDLFLNCYTFIVSDKFSLFAKGIEVLLYVDNVVDFECADCLPLPVYQMTGMRFSLHSRNTYPDVIADGITLFPGTLTDAMFVTKEWKMMEPPYGKCSKALVQKYSFTEGDFLYSLNGCKKYIIQELLYQNCGCIMYNHIPKFLSNLNKTDICSYLKQPTLRNESSVQIEPKQFLPVSERLACQENVSAKFLDDYLICTHPCLYYTFEPKISSGIYPTKSYHIKFAQDIQNILMMKINHNHTSNLEKEELRLIVNKLEIYSNISKLKTNGFVDKAAELLSKADVIEKNFLTVNINRQDFSIIKLEEKPVISLTSFLSQIGGMFSIWSGITFFCIVELMELIINIFETVLTIRP